MAGEVTIRATLTGKLQEAYRKLADGISASNKDIENSNRRAQKSADDFYTAGKKLVTAIAGLWAFKKTTDLIWASVKAYDEQIKAEQQLTIALGKTSEALIQQANELQKVTLYGDEQIIQAQARLAMLVKEEGEIKKLIPLVQDLATAKKMDLVGAADLVARAVGGDVTSFRALGIKLESTGGTAERTAEVMRELERAVGGSAKAAAEAGKGPLQLMQNRFDEMKETLGKALLPVIIETATAIEEFFTAGLEGDELEKKFQKIADVSRVIIAAVQDTANTIIGMFKMAAGMIDGFMGIIFKALEQFFAMLTLIPARLLPDGWAENIREAEKAMKDLGEAGVTAGEKLIGDAVKNFEKTGKAVDAYRKIGEETAKSQKKLAGGGITGAPPTGKPEGDRKRLDALKDELNLEALANISAQSADLERLQMWYDEREAILVKAGEDTLLLEAVFNERKEAIDEKYRRPVEDFRRELEMRFLTLTDQRAAELEAIKLKYEEEKSLEQLNKEDLAKLEETYRLQKKSINDRFDEQDLAQKQDTASKMREIEERKQDAILSAASAGINAMESLFGKNKVAFAAQKALALAEIFVNTQRAAIAAIAPPPLGLGPVAGSPLAMWVKIQGALSMAAVAAQTIKGFQFGGAVGNRDTVPAMLTPGEVVVTNNQQRQFLNAMNGAGVGATFAPTIIINGSTDPETTARMVSDSVQEQLMEFARTRNRSLALQI